MSYSSRHVRIGCAALLWIFGYVSTAAALEAHGFVFSVGPELALGSIELNTHGQLATEGRTVYVDRFAYPIGSVGLAANVAYTFVSPSGNFSIGPYISGRYLPGFSTDIPLADAATLTSPDGSVNVRLNEEHLTGNLHLAAAAVGVEFRVWRLGLHLGYGLLRAEFFPLRTRNTLLAAEGSIEVHLMGHIPITERTLAFMSAGYYAVLFDDLSLLRRYGMALISVGVEFDVPFRGAAR